MYRFTLLFFSSLLLCCSCQWQSTDSLLAEAEETLRTRIDSANLILDAFPHPERLSGKQQARYCWLKAICVANLFSQWELADSLNNIAIDYFRQTHDSIRVKNALFFSGQIGLNTNNQDAAISRFSELNEMASFDGRSESQAYYHFLISQCYFNKKNYEQALLFSKKSLNFANEQDTIDTPNYYRHAATIFVQTGQTDSAWVCYEKAVEILLNCKNEKRLVSYLYSDMTNLLLSNKNFKEAFEYAGLSLQYKTSRKDIALFNLAKARIFLATNQPDSARIYLERTITTSENSYLTILAYQNLSEVYKMNDNYEKAVYQLLNYDEFWERGESSIKADLLRQKYQEEQLKNKSNELKLVKKEKEIYVLIFALLISIAGIVVWILFSEERKKKRIREQQIREQALKDEAKIAEHENKLLKQEKELSQLREKAAILRESLFRKMSVSEKIPSLDASGNHPKEWSNKRISLEEKEWTELIQTTNEIFNGFASRLKKDYPCLSADDIGFCCLLKISVSMQDLADIYCISKAGITKRKTRMKKEKFQISDNSLDLDGFILEY
jgi:tetratricopeptide (TPR) repeat protein